MSFDTRPRIDLLREREELDQEIRSAHLSFAIFCVF